jgi:TolB-like protein
MTEQLIAELAKIKGLRVISRTSVMPVPGRPTDFRVAARPSIEFDHQASPLLFGRRLRSTARRAAP